MITYRALALALDVLESLVDDGPCVYDHTGTCQEHSGEVDGRCANLVMIDLLDDQRPGWSE